jgi:porin
VSYRAAIGLLTIAWVLQYAAHARAEDTTARRELGRHLFESPELIGDPRGARSQLERLGIVVQLFYSQTLSGKPSGGGADREGVFGHSGGYDFFSRIDLAELVGWRGADFLVHAKGMYDNNLNEDVGALSDPIDDADFDEPIYVDELWLRQSFLDDRLRFRLGFLEQQTIFDRNAFANSEDRQFLSAFLDNNGLVPLPNGLGVTAIAVPVPWLEIALGAADADNRPRRMGFDTAFDGIDSITGYVELKLASPWSERGFPGHTRLGGFIDGRRKTDFRTGRKDRGHLGAYLSFDQQVWHEAGAPTQGLGLLARAGYADRHVNSLAWFWSVGAQYVGLVPGRGRDVVGLACYQAIGSNVYRDEVDRGFDQETGIELYYRIAPLPSVAVTPDFQYIFDPGATGRVGDTFVGSIRLRVAF